MNILVYDALWNCGLKLIPNSVDILFVIGYDINVIYPFLSNSKINESYDLTKNL